MEIWQSKAAERRKGIRIKRGCIALCAVSLKVDGKLYEVKPGFYFLYLCEQRVNIRAWTRIWSLLQ